MLVKGLVYILQSEEYELKKFLRYVYTHLYWWNLEQRKSLKWTKKSGAIFGLSLLLFLILTVAGFYWLEWWGFIWLFGLFISLPLIVAGTSILVWPLDYYLKKKIINKAGRKIKKLGVIVIGITGSYGKTSTKEILATILSQKFRVLSTPENINTNIGVAMFVNEYLQDERILIVEMGAYKRGEIKTLCDMVGPDYAILTGINEAHLERFGSLENTIKAKFELPEATKKKSYLNFSDERVRENANKFKIKKVVGVDGSEVKNIKAKENFGGIEFDWQGEKLETKLLAKHNVMAILLAAKLALELGVEKEKIVAGVEKIKYIAHRLEPIYNNKSQIWVIDDSYNANRDGVKSGLEVLGRAKGRKVVLTPGPIVEYGPDYCELHKKIGKMYAKNVDLVLLIKSKETDCVIKGLEAEGFKDYKQYKNTRDAHKDLKNVLRRGDTLLLQNDFPDVYF